MWFIGVFLFFRNGGRNMDWQQNKSRIIVAPTGAVEYLFANKHERIGN